MRDTTKHVIGVERSALWALAVAAFPPYADYQKKTARQIPVFIAESAKRA